MISREDAAGEGISVIVPFYGMELASLERCVEAILGQEDPGGEVELIVVDNHPARDRMRHATRGFGRRGDRSWRLRTRIAGRTGIGCGRGYAR
jgi:cellulose synthase/poly-beta-1,6-N-acetylglucosamine synthase-like glycosyltransferase